METVERTNKRWTVEEVHRLADLGVFGDKAPYELLDGELVEKPKETVPHAHSVDNAYETLREIAKPDHHVQGPHPITLDDRSEPEPDVSIVRGSRKDYPKPPRAADVALVVEVCDASFRDDRRRKLPLYARAGIPEVWLLDVLGRRLLVHTEPAAGEYRLVRTLPEEARVAPTFRPEASVAVADLLP